MLKNFTKDSGKEFIEKLFWIIVGNIFSTIAINMFFASEKLLAGGLTGISLIIQYITEIPSGIILLVFNIPIFIIAAKRIDKEFAFYSAISSFILSIFLTLTKGLNKYVLIDDILITALIGGALNGLGMGIIIRLRASQGGLDILAAVLKKEKNMNLSSTLTLLNGSIIFVASFLFGIRPAVYTMIATFLAYRIYDMVQLGFDAKKNIVILTKYHREIGNRIMEELSRSVTYLDAVGGYKKENISLIYSIVVSTEVVKLKEIVYSIDSSAFMIVSDVVEVEGSTFKKIGI